MASKIASALSGLAGLTNQTTVPATIDPTLLNFLQNQGDLAARFQGSQEGLPFGGSTATTAQAGFNQYGAVLNANQTANQVAAAQSGIQNALTGGGGAGGTGAGLAAGSGATSTTGAA